MSRNILYVALAVAVVIGGGVLVELGLLDAGRLDALIAFVFGAGVGAGGSAAASRFRGAQSIR